MKCIVFVRTSTTRQEIESQIKETVEYAKSLEFDEYIILKKQGASAYKVNKEYQLMIEHLKETIENDPDIKAVVCWHLNRLARNAQQAMDIEDFLVQKKVQLYVKEPALKLLNDDGTLNPNAELVFSVFSVINKQQAEELQAKSHRAKVRDREAKKFLGGKVLLGYSVNTDTKHMVPDDSAKIVLEMFELYSSGKYSFSGLAQEIYERRGLKLPKYRVAQILHQSHYWDGTYQPIITKELFDKCAVVMSSSADKPCGWKHTYFASKLISCPTCGRHYVADGDSYRCINRCSGSMVSISNVDGLLWTIASHLEGEYQLKDESREQLREKKAVLGDKIKSMGSYTTKAEKMRQRAKEAYLEGVINLEEYKARVDSINQDVAEVETKIANWKTEIAEIDVLVSENQAKMARVLEISGRLSDADEQEMCTIVRKWCKGVEITDDKIVTVHTLVRDYQLKYSRYNTRSRWSTVHNKPLVIIPIIRDKGKCYLKEVDKVKAVKAFVNTIAWLGGSVVI